MGVICYMGILWNNTSKRKWLFMLILVLDCETIALKLMGQFNLGALFHLWH